MLGQLQINLIYIYILKINFVFSEIKFYPLKVPLQLVGIFVSFMFWVFPWVNVEETLLCYWVVFVFWGKKICTERGFTFIGMKVVETVLHLDYDDGSRISAKFFFFFSLIWFSVLFVLCDLFALLMFSGSFLWIFLVGYWFSSALVIHFLVIVLF